MKNRNSLTLSLTGIGILSIGVFSGCTNKEKQKLPNILLILSDELAPEYLGCYGGSIPTPNIDRLGKEGILFDQAYTAAPMCTPSRYSVLTGKYPGRCKHPVFLEENPVSDPYIIAWNTFISSSEYTIARLLSENGYTTGMAGKWHIGKFPDNISLPELNADDDPTDAEVNKKLKEYQLALIKKVKEDAGFDEANSVLWENFDGFPVKALQYHNFPWITYGAIKFIDQQQKSDKPFFLYVATTAIHGPPHQEMLDHDISYTIEGRMEGLEKYSIDKDQWHQKIEGLPSNKRHLQTGIMELDHHVGQLLKTLEEKKLLDNTMIIFIADHNIEPGKATCFEKGFKIPMIIRYPKQFETGIRTNALVQTVDLYTTIAKMAGANNNAKMNTDGVNLLPILKGKTDKVRDYVYLESGLARGVTDGDMKLIAFRYPLKVIEKMKSGELDYAPNQLNLYQQAHSAIAIEHFLHYFDPNQLYDLRKDPYEQINVINQPEYSDIQSKLLQKLEEYLSEFEHPYDLSDTTFMLSEEYKALTAKTKAQGTDHIEWLKRDHGEIVWPSLE